LTFVSGRLLAAALALVVAGAALAGCYRVPEPDCGFVCGPSADTACPDDYTCAGDHRCHRNGAPANLTCPAPDAGAQATPDAPPIDAPIDAVINDAA
jgi:hypothetical protein